MHFDAYADNADAPSKHPLNSTRYLGDMMCTSIHISMMVLAVTIF